MVAKYAGHAVLEDPEGNEFCLCTDPIGTRTSLARPFRFALQRHQRGVAGLPGSVLVSKGTCRGLTFKPRLRTWRRVGLVAG